MSSARMEKALHAVWISCSVLQYAAVCCSVLQYAVWRKPYIFCGCCSVLQRVAVCCCVLQCVAVYPVKLSSHEHAYSHMYVFKGPWMYVCIFASVCIWGSSVWRSLFCKRPLLKGSAEVQKSLHWHMRYIKYWIYHCIKESSVWRNFFCKRDP